MRYHGSVYPLPSLYNMHQGRQPPLRTKSNVHVAIQRLLQRDAQLRSLEFAPDLQSNMAFSDEEHRCLLQALLDGTIQPDLYRGRMLPVAQIDSLQAYVDNMVNWYVQFATTQQNNPQSEFYQQRTDDQPIGLYTNAIATDTILHVTTGAYVMQQDWYRSFLDYIHMHDCPEPSIIVRALLRNDPHHASLSPGDANAKVLSAMATHKKHRKHHKVKDSDNDIPANTTMEFLISTRDLVNQPPNPYFGNNQGYDPSPLTPLRNLANRLQAFLAVVDTSPQRLQYSPGIRKTSFQDVTAQTSIHLGSSSGQPLHHQSAADIEQQRYTFNTNVNSHYLMFPEMNTSTSNQVNAQPVYQVSKPTTTRTSTTNLTVSSCQFLKPDTWTLQPWNLSHSEEFFLITRIIRPKRESCDINAL